MTITSAIKVFVFPPAIKKLFITLRKLNWPVPYQLFFDFVYSFVDRESILVEYKHFNS